MTLLAESAGAPALPGRAAVRLSVANGGLAGTGRGSGRFREGYVLAKPNASHLATIDAEEAAEGLIVRRRFSRFGQLRLIEIAAGDTTLGAVARLTSTGRYEFVEPDYVRHVFTTPNDPDFSQQYALSNNGSAGGIAGDDIHATAAWNVATGAPNVIVAIVDSGILTTHVDLAANLWVNSSPGLKYSGDTDSIYGLNAVVGSGLPTDDLGHGTHVSGIVGAVGNNGVGVCGVAWKVQLMALKFISSQGEGSVSAEITCIDYAITKGAAVINASYGDTAFSVSEYQAILAAGQHGIVFVAAAGNSTQDNDVSPEYPADLPLDNIIAVGASDSRDTPASFSNHGSGSVELYAPGVDVLSTYNTSSTAYALLSGTSMATPFVTGTVALLRAQYPTDTYRETINRILNGVDPTPTLTGLCLTGGRLDLATALTPATSNKAPPNATFATRTLLRGFDPYVRGNNADSPAATEAGTPAILGNIGGHSLWYQWTAPESGTIQIGTQDSGFNALLGVYAGSVLGSLTQVAASGTAAPLGYAQVTFHAQAGATYEINIQGASGASGQLILSINTTPDSDAFATPLVLSGASVSLTDANVNASLQAGEPKILGNPGGHSLWYSWTSPRSGTVQVSAYSYNFLPEAAVYTGSSLSSLNLVSSSAGSADVGTTTAISEALCTFNATAGVTYLICVDGETSADTGEFVLTIDDSRWQSATTDAVTCSPAVGPDGSVYIGGDDNTFYAFNPDGSVKWTHVAADPFDTSAAAVGPDGTVYAGCFDGNLYAFNPDGSMKWTFAVPTPSDPTLDSGIASSPSLGSDGTVYFKADDGNLYALNSSGAVRWTYPVSGFSYAAPSIGSDGTVYIGTDSGTMFALTSAGALKWTYTTPVSGDEIYTTAAIDAAGNIYFGTLGGSFFSLNSSGSLRWTRAGGAGISSSPAVSAGGTVYYGGYDGVVNALSAATGTTQWTYTLGAQVRASSPAIDANGVIYIGCYDGNLYALNSTGTLKRTYPASDVIRSSPVIAGTTLVFGSEDHKVYAFDIGAGLAGAPWPAYQNNARRLGRASSDALALTELPIGSSVATGAPVTLAALASGAGPLSYQWFLNGSAVTGAVNSTYVIASASAANAGGYTVSVTGPQGTVTSAAVSVSVGPSALGRIVNLSARAQASTGGSALIAGFVIGGSGSKQVVLRGVGPTLAALGVTGALAHPQLTLFNSAGTSLASNLAWGGSALLSAAFSQVGAFSYTSSSSADTALLQTLATGAYTAQVSSADGTTGVALAEIYDADAAGTTSFLSNISARAEVGTGSGILIAGFVVGGNQPVKLLLRGVGPDLANLGLSASSVLAKPQLDLYNADGTVIQSNAGWGGSSALTAAFTQVGAFSLPSGSADAAMIVTLAPGNYTVQVTGVGGTTGIALAEVYLMNP